MFEGLALSMVGGPYGSQSNNADTSAFHAAFGKGDIRRPESILSDIVASGGSDRVAAMRIMTN